MNIQQAPAGITDEEWIAKYRAAIDAVPIEQSRWVKLRALLDDACRVVFANVTRAINKWKHPMSLRRAVLDAKVVSAQPRLSTISREEADGVFGR
ncbi:MAG TPA: hypothetical protein VJ999_07560 [Candidatus Sulfotelmatobacter sp.]|nr:hypothetical protein [Candidatus Sulfotelmatobacter sp.]